MRFEFATAARLVFGLGTLPEAVSAARMMGRRALLVTGRNMARAAALGEALERAGVSWVGCGVPGEPTLEDVERGVALARAEGCELVIGMGGGSAMDAAKAIAAMLTNRRPLLDYLEVIGGGLLLESSPAPCITVPTTAGTGGEVTRNAVLLSRKDRVKVSLRSPLMLPRLAVVDPTLGMSMSPEVTASTGLDALTQLIEPYLCNRANPLTDGFCVEGMRRAARSLRRVVERGDDVAGRTDMALASLLGGLALANAGLGAVHGFAAPLGGMFPAPHGAVCAALLPHVMQANHAALRTREPASPVLERFGEVARLLTGRAQAVAEDGIAWISDLVRDLGIPGLGRYGIGEADVAALVGKAREASSMKANPVVLTEAELADLVRRAM